MSYCDTCTNNLHADVVICIAKKQCTVLIKNEMVYSPKPDSSGLMVEIEKTKSSHTLCNRCPKFK